MLTYPAPTQRAADKSSMVVYFHILRSPNGDGDPTIVRQALPGSSKIGEILWNFSHHKGDKCLTLEKNPHFYCELPTCSTKDVDKFISQPTESFKGTIFVLTTNSRRIFFDIGEKQRAFDNVWDTNKTLIFQGFVVSLASPPIPTDIFPDISGKLEGEAIVRESTIGDRLLVRRATPPLMQPTVHIEVEDWASQIRGALDLGSNSP
ncbi:hypothetical protein BC826DRAFT_1069000 [Russula brevipes]|nr:hypothetical protein BC826DRAFT_1069000 [Russula brevipes]